MWYSPLHKRKCCCMSSSLDRYCRGTTQSFCTGVFSWALVSGICLHSQCHGSVWTKKVKYYTIYYYNTANMSSAYIHWQVPCQIDIWFVLVHPDFCHPKCIAPSVKGNITVVGLFCSCNMGHSGTRQNFHASPTQPNLGFKNTHTPIKLQFWHNFRRKKLKFFSNEGSVHWA